MARLFPAVPYPHTAAMHLALRSVRSEDEDFLFRLYASTRQEEISAWGWDAGQQEAFLRMQFRAQRHGYAADYPESDYQVILADDEPVGRLIVNRTKKEVRLVDIAVLPEYRNRGLGAALINDLMAECQASRKPLRLQVAKGNRAARLYERLGFLTTGEDDVYWHMWWDPIASTSQSQHE
jgi:ribosomal protein S18 acetylase RimI-like enzyme